MVRLRLTRMGRKKRPYYRIIAVDGRKKRDGAFLERLGYYHPLDNPAAISIDAEKTLKWLRVGAQPSETVRSLLRKEGIWYRFRLEKRGLPESQIQTMMVEWFEKNKQVEAEKAQKPAKVEVAPSEETPPTREVTEATPVEEVKGAVVETPPAEEVKEAAEETPPAEEAKEATEEAAEESAEEKEETPITKNEAQEKTPEDA